MSEGLVFMLPAAAACVVLAGIHCYLGLHVVAREIYFADLALTQMAALGGAIALVQGFELTTWPSYGWSLAATFAGAALFTWSRRFEPRVSHEAVIGVVYVVSTALTLLVMDKAPEGPDQLKSLLVGSLLLTPWPAVAGAAALYALVGVVHWAYRKPLLAISFGRPAKGHNVTLWDFFFFATFGLVVTSSVRIAGVLVVFTLLVVPAMVAAALAKSPARRLALGWGMGVVLAVAGVAASYAADVSTGAAVVTTFGAALFGLGLVVTARRRARA